MRPLVLFNHFSPHPNAATGITVYSWRILEALARSGRYRYVLWTNWDADALPPAFSELGVQIKHRHNYQNEGLAWLNDAAQMAGLVRQSGADLIFSPHPFGAVTGGVPRVLVAHDLRRVQHPELHSWRSRLQWNLIFPLTIRQSSAIVAVSNATRNAIGEFYPDVLAKTRVVHEASPLAAPSGELHPPNMEKPYGLMVANITSVKRLGILTEAMRKLKARGRSVGIVLVGRNDSADAEFTAARADGLDLRTIGGQSDTDLQRLYAHADFYVNTSLVEGFCLPILEAQTMGLPIICSDLRVLREVAGDGAIYFPPNDSDSLANAMESLLGGRMSADVLRAAAKENVARFSWERAAKETEAVFDDVLSYRSDVAQVG
jgi:glycosyltransferase involved in cell wall biosynthesis